MSFAIQAEGPGQRFGATTALDGVDLAVPAGTILGVLGPNGAGKTTTVRILAAGRRDGDRRRIRRAAPGAIQGDTGSYLQITLPGVMAMNMVFGSLGTGMALNTDISKGVFDRFRSLPVARSAPLIGAVLGDIVRYLVSLAVLLIFATIMGFRIQTGPLSALAAILVVIAFALAMCWITVFLGMLIKSQQALPEWRWRSCSR